ncbi:MAG TPA: DinB family protein [Terriglobales bacterium]
MNISQSLLPEFDQEFANTRKLLAVIPEKWDYKPHEKSMALGRLANHVAEMPEWARTTVTTELLDGKDGDYQPVNPKSREELLAKFDKDVAAARKAIEALNDDEWQKTWTFKWNGQTIFSMPRTATYRSMVMNHLVHHRAQLGVYCRLNEVEIPGMYGPSADEMKFFQEKQESAKAS